MAPKKKVQALIKLQIQAGAATPAPPVGPALGQHGVNIMDFVKQYNAATEKQKGEIVPVEITVQCEEIATLKKDDLNANDVAAGAKIIAGTARSMGIVVK